MTSVFSAHRCHLGEGPLWHPERNQLFWFDILEKQCRTLHGEDELVWSFDEHVSAAGWIDRDTVLMASETGLYTFNLNSGDRALVAALEAENPMTRSNDGRADPYGGFWIGTMGKKHEPRAGAIYRYYRGEIRQLYGEITISNSICFSPDGLTAYYTDTGRQRVFRQRLHAADGWPVGEPEVFLDLRSDGLFPDGAVVDADGRFCSAQWGASRVAVYSQDGVLEQTFAFPTPHVSCPAFGGAGCHTLFVTTAYYELGETAPGFDTAGKVYAVQTDMTGQSEHRVIL
ncbi:MAG: SMP-30/gluconolactonase/LRE family protein [Pseudomonadota bacterium]